ncbi:MAG: aldehyde dehydrogenase family protein, partial [Proteobacteria bacterium]
IMADEIFGPVLPILAYQKESDLQDVISRYEKPLALYVFSGDDAFSERIITTYSFGGGCVNDVLVHCASDQLPFGGVGHSGTGAYHGKYSFETFTHKKAIVKKATWLDIPLRYAPYGNRIDQLRKWLKWL